MNEEKDTKKQDKDVCAPVCACGSSGSRGRCGMFIGIIILVIAGGLVVRAVVKDNGAQAVDNAASSGFAALPAVAGSGPEVLADGATQPAADTLKEIESFSDLNALAGDMFGVFVFLPGKGETAASAPIAQIQSAVRTIEPQLRGGKIGVFVLKAGSRDYEQVAMQTEVPGVLAMVKGGGMSATSGEITETKIVQALVAASSSGGCGAGGGGCGPRGCN